MNVTTLVLRLGCVINTMAVASVKHWWLEDSVTVALLQHSGSVVLGVSAVTAITLGHKMSSVTRRQASADVTHSSQHLVVSVTSASLASGTSLTANSVSAMDTLTPATPRQGIVSTAGTTP